MVDQRPGSRRALLGDAAIAILAREGGRGLTHRAVDREAEVPQGTTKNYFPTRESLLEAAAARMTEEHRAAVDRLKDTTPAHVSPSQLGQLYPALLHRAVNGDPTQLLAMAELYLEAVRRPGVRQALGEMAIANAESAVALHQVAGLDSTTRDVGVLDAYLLGISLSLLALPADALRRIGLDDPYSLGLGVFAAAVGQRPDGDTEIAGRECS